MTTILLLTAVILWGLSFVATKMCLEYMSPAELVAARFIFALPVLMIAVSFKRLSFSFFREYWKLILGCSVILVMHLLIQVEGMKTTTATNTAWLITTIPVFIAIFAFIILKERMHLRQILGIAVAVVGVLLLVSRGDFGSMEFLKSYGDWLVLTSCVTWTIYTILLKKISQCHPLAVVTIILTLAAIFLVPPVIIHSGIRGFFLLPAKIVLALVFLENIRLFCI